MMKPILLFLYIVVFSLFLFACNKRYEDDPITMKLVSLKKRIVGEWTLEKVLVDGADSSHIIFDDSLRIFSKFHFKYYDKRDNDGVVIVSNYNNTYIFNDVRYFLGSEANSFVKPGQISLSLGTLIEGYVKSRGLKIYGPINNFSSNTYPWDIQKLTKKEMHLLQEHNSKQYKLFFTKN